MLYSQEVDRSRKFSLALRIALPILTLTSIIIFIILKEKSFSSYDIALLVLTIFVDVYFIFLMIEAVLSKRIIDLASKTFNRDAILPILQKNIDKKDSYTVVLISLDNLIDINERYGIEKGDKILEKFAILIDSFLKNRYKKVPIGHYKAEEFLIGIEDSLENVKKILDSFLKKYDKTKIEDIEIRIFAALTDKNYSSDIKKIIEFLNQLYTEHKYSLKSKRVLVAKQKNLEANSFEKFVIESIENKNLSLRFQPSLNLKTNKYELIEVSVKLLKENSIIHPSDFMPVINRLGFEKIFDEILIEKIVKTIENNNLPTDRFYSFNVSPFSIRDRNFSEKIFKKFDFSKLNLVFELFENRVYKDIEYYKNIIQEYKNSGVKIAFDNFGEQNAAYEYIKEIKPDFIYFDKEYVKMIDNSLYYNLLKNWVHFFNDIKTKTVVKFVDRDDKLNYLKDIGVDYVQGYLISKPLDSNELKNFLKGKE